MLPVALAWIALVLGACGSVDDASPTPNGPSADPSSASPHATASPTPAATAEASPQAVYVDEADGWSIAVPPGWDVATFSPGDPAFTRDQAFAEILVSPASGLTLEQLQAQRLDELSAWPGIDSLEGQIVRLPAGEAVRTTLEITHPNGDREVLVWHAIEDRERQYVILVRGPRDDDRLLQDAEAFAEAFALTD